MKRLFGYIMLAMLAVCSTVLVSCGDDENEGGARSISKSRLSGKVEKGPFVQGSEVIIYELTSGLAQTGKSFRSQTDNYLGEFNLNTAMDLVSPYIELSVSGYYYNEVKGDYSGPITLRAVADITNRSSVNVNLLTHLERGRVLKLIQQGLSFGDAKKQADRELMAVFAITDKVSNPEDISIADNNDNAGILLAISTIMLYNRTDAELSELISLFSNEFAQNGQIVSTTVREAIQEGQNNARPSEVIENMKNFYIERGITLLIQDFSKFVDFNGDGVIDDNDEVFHEDKTVVVEENFWNTDNELLQVLGGSYLSLWKFVNAQQGLEWIRTNDKTFVHSIAPENTTLSEAFTSAYKTINYTNFLIANAPSMIERQPDSEDRILAIAAEARVIRAFIYYNLATLWGNVPLITEPITIDDIQSPVQAEQATVYEFAYQEVCEALQFLSTPLNWQSSYRRFDKNSALMLKAELELTINKTNEANSTLSIIESDPNLVLWDENNVIVHIYTPVHRSLYKQEAEGLSNAYLNWPSDLYGYWATLKRYGKAQEITECYDYELLMPFPSAEVRTNQNITQNPGY